ncbi:MAG: DUF3253 domain-containing protein [Alphaproteobacteria bacterium]|nr:DUF3253 domain-containing protein [Alphaproteobacteria bacterium]
MDPLDATILRLTQEAGAGKSISPSDVAMALEPQDGEWQKLLPRIRARAVELVHAGKIEILRKGKPVPNPEGAKGVIRLRIVSK